MKRRTISTSPSGASLLAAATAFAPAAQAGNVAWSVELGGPGFAVAAGQPGYWRRLLRRARYLRSRSHRPYYRPWYRAAVAVLPPVAYVRPPVGLSVLRARAGRRGTRSRMVYAPRPIAWAHGYAVAASGLRSY